MLQSLAIEFPPVITWYLACLALGWGMFPLTFTLFRHFPDRGFSLSKILGLFLLSYGIWLSTSLGISHYNRQSILTAAILLLLMNAALLFLQWREFWRYVYQHVLILLNIEAVFLLFFLVALAIRLYSPDITGAEKEADFTLLNALLHSDTFPPKDTWFAGATINYYYFGYLLWATMIHLTGIIAPVGFNLAVVAIVALSSSGAFGLVYAFTRKNTYSLVAAVFLMALGNLDGVVQLVQRNGNLLPFNWWQSSRIIPDTINEFPFFSFLLGDLHAHFMSIPGGILFLGLLAQWLFTALSQETIVFLKQIRPHTPGMRKKGVYFVSLFVSISLVLGGTSVINGWDYPTDLLLTIGCVVFILIRYLKYHNTVPSFALLVLTTLGCVVLLVLSSRIFFWPFYQHFAPQVKASNLCLVATTQRTNLKYFLIIYGLFLWGILLFASTHISILLRQWKSYHRASRLVFWNVVLLLIIVVYLLGNTWVIPIACVIVGFFAYLLYTESGLSSDPQESAILPYFLIVMAFAIIAGCEIVYIKDFYGHPLERQNTVFKFYYQAWIFLSIGTPYLLMRFFEDTDVQRKRLFRLTGKWGLALLCAGCAIYPVFATYERAAYFRGGQQGGLLYLPTLNGISYIAFRYPQEYEALQWIQDNLSENAVILEATGNPYSFFGRVSSVTGRSTVLGWGNHEALWRDQTWQSITQRTDDIKKMYEAIDKSQVADLLRAYAVDYVYLGKLEQESYATEGLKAFERNLPVAYRNAFVTIYRVPDTT